MAKKNKSFTYVIALLVVWLLGCLFQYFFCCKTAATELSAAAPATGVNSSQPETVSSTSAPVTGDADERHAQPSPMTDNTPSVDNADNTDITALQVTNNAFSIKGVEELAIDLPSEDNFNFFADKAQPVQPISQGLQENVKKIGSYLSENPHRQLLITGLYEPGETNSSIFPNLGLARANSIKDYFVSQGIDARQINMSGELYAQAISDTENKYFGMAEFAIEELDDSHLEKQAAEMQKLADEIKANPVVLYFATGNVQIQLDDGQRNALFNINRYLSFNDKAKVVVTGHTDNTGNTDANIKLGEKRARFAADYLIKKGLKEERISVTSAGPNEPIADNKTEQGRAKNRRVVISITDKQ